MKVRILLLVLSMLALVLVVGRAVGVIPGLSPDTAVSRNQNPETAVSLNESSAPRAPRYNVSPLWYEGADGYNQAESQHRESQTALIVYFYTDWCPYCQQLNRDLWPSEEVHESLRSVLKVRVNPENGPDSRALANRFGVHGYPEVFVLPAQSDEPTRINPFKRVGNTWELSPSEFVSNLHRAGAL